MSKVDRALSIFLTVAIVATLGWIVYIAATPKKGEKFTQFYVVGTEGRAQDYPIQAFVGKPVNTIVGVVNHEYQPASYIVKITINGVESKTVNIGALTHGAKWEEKISFIPQVPGDKQLVYFYLYKDGGDRPYLKDPIRLYIDVTVPFR
jgi:uncharacterized membrane protein